MTDRERELLADLKGRDWSAPLDLGASNSSHHSTTLKRMIPKGWVLRKYRGYDPGEKRKFAGRGSCLYKITPQGAQALANATATAVAP